MDTENNAIGLVLNEHKDRLDAMEKRVAAIEERLRYLKGGDCEFRSSVATGTTPLPPPLDRAELAKNLATALRDIDKTTTVYSDMAERIIDFLAQEGALRD